MKRWLWILLVLVGIGWRPAGAADRRGGMDFERAAVMAQQLAAVPFQDHRRELPRRLRRLTYDELRHIRFNEKEAIWRLAHLPFQLQFFHPGFIHEDQITVHLVDGDTLTTVPFDTAMFDYGAVAKKVGRLDPDDLSFSGFRVLYPLNAPDKLDEVIVFQGASYFRALGQGLRYGLSARTLALRTACAEPEEFPRYRAFWVRRPDSDAKQLQLYGVFDGPSLAGAAEFLVQPGTTTVVDVRVALFPRVAVAEFGIAPLTSMFWFGKNSPTHPADYRPEVHDSDGILLQTGRDEWLWRPLVNSPQVRSAAFADENPKGFGLLQRERAFGCYEDLEALYQLRPSVWIEPQGAWGKGRVRLVELPTRTEFDDNIVAYWTPEEALTPGQRRDFRYRQSWFGADTLHPALGRTVATRLTTVAAQPEACQFVLDFRWPQIAADATQGATPEPVVTAQGGSLTNLVGQWNSFDQTWRVFFTVQPQAPATPVELRAFVRKEGRTLTETWTYLWTP